MKHPETICFRLLGDVDLRLQSGQAVPDVLRHPKPTALLAYLVLAGGGAFIRRDRLVAIFWPESDRAHARASLRQAARFLRARMGERVVENRGREEMRLPLEGFGCDALTFQRHVSAGEHQAALDLYRGPLLEGFFLDGCYEFQDWLDERRSSFQRRAAKAAWGLAEEAREQMDVATAAFQAKRALSLSAFDEPGVRKLMRILLDVGDHAGAMRAYRGLERKMMADFGVRVSPATRQLVEGLASATEDVPAAPYSLGRRSGDERRSQKVRRVARRSVAPGAERRVGSTERRSGERRVEVDRRGAP